MALPEVFVNVTPMEVGGPAINCGSKATSDGEIEKVEVGVTPWPSNVNSAAPLVAFAVSEPGLSPKAFGVKVMGTETL